MKEYVFKYEKYVLGEPMTGEDAEYQDSWDCPDVDFTAYSVKECYALTLESVSCEDISFEDCCEWSVGSIITKLEEFGVSVVIECSE